MKRVGLAVVLVVVAVMVAPAVAWGDPIPLCNGQQCVIGQWYKTPVSVTWDLNGGSNGGGCAPQNYASDVDQSYLQSEPPADWPAWTYCYDPTSGIRKNYFIRVELSAPTATVTPSRPPDSNGWYDHPVTGTPTASSFSGIASCTSTTYAGSDSTAATVSATCVDNAGKTATATSPPFAYDVTPPSLTAAASPADHAVTLSWQAGGFAPVVSVSVTRSAGKSHNAAVTVYRGDADRYVDVHVRNGVRYTYTVTAIDQAGHATVQTVVAIPAPRLLAPMRDAHVSAPPMLRWTPVAGATYYNVQLYRRGKVLSMWPTHADLQLRRHWRFDGHRYRLKRGKYRWFVWPGFGKRSAARYGHAIGSGTFVVVH